MKKLLSIMLLIICVVALVGCGTDVATSGSSTDGGSSSDSAQSSKTYTVGEKVTVSKDGKDLYTLTINSVKPTDERNQFAENDPKQVVIINFTYENLAQESDLFITGSLNFKIIDADGNVCTSYPAGSLSQYAQQTPTGAKCTAEEAYGLMSDSADFKLMFYDNIFNSKADATFELSTAN